MTGPPLFGCWMCKLAACVKRAYKSSVFLHKSTPFPLNYLEINCQTLWAVVHAAPKHKHTPVILGGMPLALQIIAWFAGSVTNYWRTFEVYGLAQRLWSHAASENHTVLSAIPWEDFFRPNGTPYFSELTLSTDVRHFVFSNGSHLPLGVTSSKVGHQREPLSSLFRCFSAQASYPSCT